MRLTKLSSFSVTVGLLLLAAGSMRGASNEPQGAATPKAGAANGGGYTPVKLPDPGIPGFKFPEDEATILNWVKTNDQHSISKHAWGIWTAMNMSSGETFEGQDLSVFETWVTPQDVLSLGPASLAKSQRDPRPVSFLRQFSRRIGERAGHLDVAAAAAGESSVLGFVKYDPTAALHITSNSLLAANKLNQLLSAGQTAVPSFPTSAVALKVQTMTLSAGNLVGNRYFAFPVWPGPPVQPAAFPAGKATWKQCIWVDTQETGTGTGTGQVDTVWNTDGSSRTPATTYGMGNFIHFRLSSAQAAFLNALRRSLPIRRATAAAVGDYVIVAGLHVTTREITRWTWQTFWWAANPDTPPAPSSASIAADRPAQLTGPARHYAVAIGYGMVDPDQPNTGGSNVGNSVYCYNPYLEAPFGPSDLPASKPGTYNGQPVANNVGVQTNCMSCHAQACFPTSNDTAVYTGDQYIDLNGPQFQGKLRVDFLWTINDFAE